MKKELPLTRKEKFYTATIFPMIVCKNIDHINIFLSLLDIDVRVSSKNINNFNLFTEYEYKPLSEVIFDIVILISNPNGKPILIVLEGKMFHVPTLGSLRRQMDKQRELIETMIEESLQKDAIFYQYALLPEPFLDKELEDMLNKRDVKILTWERFRDAYKDKYKDGSNYFYDILCYALENYDQYKAKGIKSFRLKCDDVWDGLKIYQEYKVGNREMISMGRRKGLKGLIDDLEAIKWEYWPNCPDVKKYEVSKKDLSKERNWFTIETYVNLIDNKLKILGISS